MSVINAQKTHVALSPCDTSQLEKGVFAASNASTELPYSPRDYAQLRNLTCDDWTCSRYSDTESDTSVLSPVDQGQSYDYESPCNKEVEPEHWTFEVDQHMPLDDTISWRESGLWSILGEGEWPRLD